MLLVSRWMWDKFSVFHVQHVGENKSARSPSSSPSHTGQNVGNYDALWGGICAHQQQWLASCWSGLLEQMRKRWKNSKPNSIVCAKNRMASIFLNILYIFCFLQCSQDHSSYWGCLNGRKINAEHVQASFLTFSPMVVGLKVVVVGEKVRITFFIQSV